MSLDRTSLIEQLARILVRLESDFRELGDDALDDPNFSHLETVAERIDFAASCIAAAKRALSGGRAAHLADDARG